MSSATAPLPVYHLRVPATVFYLNIINNIRRLRKTHRRPPSGSMKFPPRVLAPFPYRLFEFSSRKSTNFSNHRVRASIKRVSLLVHRTQSSNINQLKRNRAPSTPSAHLKRPPMLIKLSDYKTHVCLSRGREAARTQARSINPFNLDKFLSRWRFLFAADSIRR